MRLRYAARVRLLSPNGSQLIGLAIALQEGSAKAKGRELSFAAFCFLRGEGDASTLPQASTLYTDSSAWFSVALGRITAKVFSRSGK